MLNEIDKKIIKTLEKQSLHPSEIARIINYPRTTVSYRLKKLQKQGAVKNKISGRKKIWKLDFKSNKDNLFIQIFQDEEFYNSYLECLNISPNSVVLSVQGVDAGEGEIKFIPKPLILKIHKYFKNNNIAFKSICNIKILDVLNTLDKEYIESHYGRGGGIRWLDNGIFLESGEIFVYEETVIISNPQKKIAIVIKEKSIAKIFHDALSLLFDSTKNHLNLNLNDYFYRKI